MIKGIDYIGSTSDMPPEPQMNESEESPDFIHPMRPNDQVSQSILAERRIITEGSSFEPIEAPAFVDTPKKEKEWQRAKEIVKEEHPNWKASEDRLWKETNTIFHNIDKHSKK